jgi:hypothetical protein
MMMFDKLTKTDKAMIENYIIENVGSLKSPLDFILRPWDRAKSEGHLNTLFKDTLIFKENVEFEESTREISERIEETIGYYTEHHKFEEAIRKIYESYSRSDNDDWYIWDNVLTLFNTYTLAVNKVELYENNPRKYIPLADGTQLKIQNGAKPMRIIEKINGKFFSEIEYFGNTYYTWTKWEKWLCGSNIKVTKRNGYYVCKWTYNGDKYKVYFGYGVDLKSYKKWHIVNYYRSIPFHIRRLPYNIKNKIYEWKYCR